MEKETFIYRKKLDSISRKIYEKHGVNIVFCKIFGNRWSWFAGCDKYFVVQKKMIINQKLGVILDQDGFEETLLNELK